MIYICITLSNKQGQRTFLIDTDSTGKHRTASHKTSILPKREFRLPFIDSIFRERIFPFIRPSLIVFSHCSLSKYITCCKDSNYNCQDPFHNIKVLGFTTI